MRVAILLFLAVLAVGCSKKGPPATSGSVAGKSTQPSPFPETDVPDGDAAFDRRVDRAGTDQAIALYEAALAADPSRADARALRVRLSILYFGLAYRFLRDGDKKERMDVYLKGRDIAISALRMNAEFARLLDEGKTYPEAAPVLGKDDAAAAFWAATNWGRWGELKGILRVALDIPKVKALNDAVLREAEDYYNAGVHRFFSAYYVAIPPFAGQDMDRGKAHCDRSLELAPRHWENQIICAEYWAAKTGRRQEYLSYLDAVLAAELDPSDPYHFEYVVAKEDAARMKAEVDERVVGE